MKALKMTPTDNEAIIRLLQRQRDYTVEFRVALAIMGER
jgi:hypothetical protein